MTTAQCRIKLMQLSSAKGKLARELIFAKPHEVNLILMSQEAVDAEIQRVGRELQKIHDAALRVCL